MSDDCPKISTASIAFVLGEINFSIAFVSIQNVLAYQYQQI